MPADLPKAEIEAAYAAVEYAKQVRAFHRRRTDKGAKSREADIRVALERLKSAMRPLRTFIGQFPYGPQTTAAENHREEIRKASEAIQKERRKLFKLKAKND